MLETYLPPAVIAGGSVYALMKGAIKKERRDHNKTKVEKELLEGERDVKITLENKSDMDIIRDAISEGRDPNSKS